MIRSAINEMLQDKPLGILCAMPEEVEEYLKHFSNVQSIHVSGVEYFVGLINHTRVIVAKCGVGKVHAATATQTLILKFEVGGVLFSGVAGALNEKLEVGDLVVSHSALQHDLDLSPLGFEPAQVPWTPWRAFVSHPPLVEAAVNAGEKLGLPILKGRVVSGDQFVADPERVKVLKEYFEGDCVEMEAGAVGQVCALNGGIPWVTIRAISDKADHSSPVDFPTFCVEAAKKSYQLVEVMLQSS